MCSLFRFDLSAAAVASLIMALDDAVEDWENATG